MNKSTRVFNLSIYAGGNSLRQNKNSEYSGTPEDKDKILNILQEKYLSAKEKSAVPIGEKNLIYCSVFGIGFVMLLELLIDSMVKKCDTSPFDVLFITDKMSQKFIRAIPNLNKLTHDFHIVDYPADGVEASMYKLNIFDYEKINDYKNILYLDTDILCVGDFSFIFKKTYDKLEVVDNHYDKFKKEGTITFDIISAATITHSLCHFLDDNKKYILESDPIIFNAGQFLFTNTEIMKAHFENVRWLKKVWPSIYFFEQSFLNQYFVLNKECNYGVLNDAVKLNLRILLDVNKLELIEYMPSPSQKLIHFAGSSLESTQKYKFIKKYIKTCL